MANDDVDRILEQWGEVRPDLDASPMGIWGRISRIERLAAREIAATLGSHGLQPSEFDVLATLKRHGGQLRPVDLRSGMMVGSGTITHRIDQLENAGLVERIPDETDRRGRVIRLTDAGRRVVDDAVVDHLATEAELLADVPDAVRRRLARDLASVLRALSARASDAGG
jgi:DNA-binding MarR family transcriptional regulator